MFESSKEYLHVFESTLETISTLLYPDDINLHKAAKYALSSGGKRIRPILCLQAAASAGVDPKLALSGAIAVEMIHTYSLIHDDLPCMDNDDLRRGKPTVHKVFGEDTALLAGDALLTDAFKVLTASQMFSEKEIPFPSPAGQLLQVLHLAQAAGGQGMVFGQALDLFWTARSGAKKADLNAIHTNKTGKLLGSATAMGAAAAGLSSELVEKFKEFGALTGLAFQIIDDLLDTSSGTGKSVGKDADAGKLTYATTMSKSDSEREAAHYTELALKTLRSTGLNTAALEETANTLLSRSR